MRSARTEASRKSIEVFKGFLLVLRIGLGFADSNNDFAGIRSGWYLPPRQVSSKPMVFSMMYDQHGYSKSEIPLISVRNDCIFG